MYRYIITPLLLCCLALPAAADEVQLRQGHPDRYVVVKGSVTVTVGGTTLTDDGKGELRAEAGVSPWSGSVDYIGGSIELRHSTGTGSSSVSATATAAGPVSAQGFTDHIPITSLNRQNNYLFQLEPLPSGGTVTSRSFRPRCSSPCRWAGSSLAVPR